MKFEKHPLFDRDIARITDHIFEATYGDWRAAERRVIEIYEIVAAIMAAPQSGIRLDGNLAGFLAKHGGQNRRLTIVFKPEPTENVVYGVLVAFGGADWLSTARQRTRFPA